MDTASIEEISKQTDNPETCPGAGTASVPKWRGCCPFFKGWTDLVQVDSPPEVPSVLTRCRQLFQKTSARRTLKTTAENDWLVAFLTIQKRLFDERLPDPELAESGCKGNARSAPTCKRRTFCCARASVRFQPTGGILQNLERQSPDIESGRYIRDIFRLNETQNLHLRPAS